MRLFASVTPPVHVLAHLRGALELATAGPALPVRWTAQENWHLTLAFFGEVPDGAYGELADLVGEVAAGSSPVELRLRGAGVFAGRTLWVGTGGQTDALAALCAAVRVAGEQVAEHRDTRERQRAHLTVGRVVDDGSAARRACARDRSRLPGPVDHLVHALALYDGPSWTVADLQLVQSWPGQGRGGGPRYEARDTFALGRGHRTDAAPVAGWRP